MNTEIQGTILVNFIDTKPSPLCARAAIVDSRTKSVLTTVFIINMPNKNLSKFTLIACQTDLIYSAGTFNCYSNCGFKLGDNL